MQGAPYPGFMVSVSIHPLSSESFLYSYDPVPGSALATKFGSTTVDDINPALPIIRNIPIIPIV